MDIYETIETFCSSPETCDDNILVIFGYIFGAIYVFIQYIKYLFCGKYNLNTENSVVNKVLVFIELYIGEQALHNNYIRMLCEF